MTIYTILNWWPFLWGISLRIGLAVMTALEIAVLFGAWLSSSTHQCSFKEAHSKLWMEISFGICDIIENWTFMRYLKKN